MSSVCSFCGGSQRIIMSLDCGQHYICDGCSYRRGIHSVCPLCANREKHSIESVAMGGMFKFSPVIAGKFFMQTGITMAHPFFHLLIPVLLLRFQIFIPPIPLPLLIIPFVARPRRALRPDSPPRPTARSVPSCRCTATPRRSARLRSARLRSWCLSTDRTIPPVSPEARSLPTSPSMAPPSPPRTPLFPSPPPPTRPSPYPLGP